MVTPKQLSDLVKPLGKIRLWVLVAIGIAVVAAAVVPQLIGSATQYQYAFTNLGPEDASEIAEQLKSAGIPFRAEAGGAAVAVPADKVYDARLLLAAQGLPRGGGVGFELFDRGDLGVSEFTQRVNLRRAIEGELARTIGHLAEVRSARVHLSFEEKSLFRDDERKAAAAVVVNIQPGRTLDDREVAGMRHLVASSVPGLAPEAVTIVDGHGRALTTDSNDQAGRQTDLERSMEQRVVSLLETVVGSGAVVARVSATVDDSEVTTNAETFDPDSATVRSETKTSQQQSQESGSPSAAAAGAAANVPPQTQATVVGSKNGSNNENQTRTFEISKTITRTVKHTPRLMKLSAAILVDGVGGKPRTPEEVTKLGEIAKKAIGFDAARGDVLDISSEVFAHSAETETGAAPEVKAPSWLEAHKTMVYAGGGAGVALILALAFMLTRRRGAGEAVGGGAAIPIDERLIISPGATIAQLEERLQEMPEKPKPIDPSIAVRNKAIEIAKKDPQRVANIIKAWVMADAEGLSNG